MKALIIVCFISSLIATPMYASINCTPVFKKVRQEDGITLYERWIPHPPEEDVREIKAVFTVTANIAKIKNLLCDAKQGTLWNANAQDYNTISVSDNSSIIYIRYDMPIAFEDRDCCLLYTFGKEENGACEINFTTAVHDKFPPFTNVTRIKGTRGKWQLLNIGAGQTQITYVITTDKSMNIPRWVSDPIVRNNLFKTMSKFKTILEKQ